MEHTTGLGVTPADFPAIAEIGTNEVCDFQLPPFTALIDIRVASILDATPLDLDVLRSDDDTRLYGLIRGAVELAYRLGLKDGLVRLGEL